MKLVRLLFIVVMATPLHASDLRITFDPQKTTIAFSVADFIHDVHGVFHLRSGAVDVDRKTGVASGSIVVDAASGDSGSGARDSKIRRGILEANRFPEIVFAPRSVVGPLPAHGSAAVQVRGVFRIHGADHDMTLTALLAVTGSTFELTTSFRLPYIAWGMKDPSTLFLRAGKEVEITIKAAGQVTARN
jgi:polyisoprenoid-binding protein YceI